MNLNFTCNNLLSTGFKGKVVIKAGEKTQEITTFTQESENLKAEVNWAEKNLNEKGNPYQIPQRDIMLGYINHLLFAKGEGKLLPGSNRASYEIINGKKAATYQEKDESGTITRKIDITY